MRKTDPSNENITLQVLRPHNTIPLYAIPFPVFFNSTVNIYAVSDSNPRKSGRLLVLAGLLTRFRPDAFPSCTRQTVAGVLSERFGEAHSSGTVRAFHPIPFYFLHRMVTEKPIRCKYRQIIDNRKRKKIYYSI